MGNCDFASDNTNNNAVGISKANFQLHYILGKGGYGKVWKVQSKKEGKEFAMKEMSKAVILAKKSETSINYERALLSRINHSFICNISYAFQDLENLYLILELCNGGDLRYHLYKNKKFNEAETKFIAACIIVGLEYIHSSLIIHRDIKPENILFDKKGYVKLTDFGIAKTWSPNNSDTSGTPGYMAPEVLLGKNHGTSVDFFALGIILHELMLGRRPYPGIQRKEYLEYVSNNNVQIKKEDLPRDWSEDSRDIINKLIQRKEEQRLGKNGSKEVKEHSWFQGINWDDIINFKTNPIFVPGIIEENFDQKYLESFDKSEKLQAEIEKNSKNLRNKNVQKQFDDYYFDRDKAKVANGK